MTSPAVTQDATAVLRVQNVVKTFGGKRALDGVSLELRRGACLGLLGPNGAGKTTLVRNIIGRAIIDSGTIDILGVKAGTAEAKAKIGWVPQEIALYPALTARENIETFGAYSGLRGPELKSAVQWCLDWASLRDRANDQTRTFSGGMKRRLNMAAGLVHRAPIVLLDEPTSAMDPWAEAEWLERFRKHAAGRTSMLITHRMTTAMFADVIHLVANGRIVESGTHNQLLAKGGLYAKSWARQMDACA